MVHASLVWASPEPMNITYPEHTSLRELMELELVNMKQLQIIVRVSPESHLCGDCSLWNY